MLTSRVYLEGAAAWKRGILARPGGGSRSWELNGTFSCACL